MYITAYEDRIHIVEKIVGILPEFIFFHFNEATLTAWCGHQVDLQAVDFQHDEEGNWLGTWTTADDKLQQDLLDEDMGYKLKFDNLQLVENEGRRRQLLQVDQASEKNFLSRCGPGVAPVGCYYQVLSIRRRYLSCVRR